MKISQIPSIAQGAELQNAKAESVRSIKMSVNRTPGLEAAEDPQLSIPANDGTQNTETNAVVEATEPLSPQFAAIAKQRRALQQQIRAFQDEKKAFEASKSQGGDSEILARLKSRPIEVLLEQGVTYEQLTDAIIAGQGNPEVNALKTKIASLEEGIDKKFTEHVTQQRAEVINEMTRNANQLVTQGDEFELIRETKSVPDVIRLIEKNYDETGEVLSVHEACKLIEDELFNRQKNLANLKKMQGIYQPAPQPAQQRSGMRTLTNNHTASAPMSAKARALAAFRGELKR